VSWGIALAAVSLLLIAVGTVVWYARDDASFADDKSPGEPLMMSQRTPPPMPPGGENIYSMVNATENGTRVVKIKVTPAGDELVVDAQTGRLLETRPSPPTPAPPVAKFAAPFDPMT
jgi:hypothetical protein